MQSIAKQWTTLDTLLENMVGGIYIHLEQYV